MITKNVKLYLSGGFPVRIPVSQFDTMWQFVFTIIKDGLTWTIPSGATAVLNGRKPDGNVFAFSGTISGNTVTVDADVQMTAVAGDTICELSIFTTEGSEVTQRAKVVGTANFVLAVEAAPNSTGATPSASDLDAYGAIISGELDTYFEQHPEMIEGKGLSEPIRLAILNCFQHVAWRDTHGQDYYDALYELLMNKEVLSITAVFDPGQTVIYTDDTLDDLKQYLTVTANYDDGTSAVVTGYTLSGSLTAGTSTITVTYADKTDSFDVTVVAPLYSVPDFAAQTINNMTVSKSNNVYTMTGTGVNPVYIYPNGTCNSSKSNTLWFTAPQGVPFYNEIVNVNWNNPTSAAANIQAKYGRSDTTGNVLTAKFVMAANSNGTGDTAKFEGEASNANNISCVALQTQKESGSGAHASAITASFKIRLFYDGVRYL